MENPRRSTPSHRHHLKLSPSGGWGSTQADFPLGGNPWPIRYLMIFRTVSPIYLYPSLCREFRSDDFPEPGPPVITIKLFFVNWGNLFAFLFCLFYSFKDRVDRH